MTMTQTIKVPVDRRVHFDFEVPQEIPTGTTARFQVIWFPVKEEAQPKAAVPIMKGRERGCHKGKIWIADDFCEPIDDFKDYI